jgi:hypothetical protein
VLVKLVGEQRATCQSNWEKRADDPAWQHFFDFFMPRRTVPKANPSAASTAPSSVVSLLDLGGACPEVLGICPVMIPDSAPSAPISVPAEADSHAMSSQKSMQAEPNNIQDAAAAVATPVPLGPRALPGDSPAEGDSAAAAEGYAPPVPASVEASMGALAAAAALGSLSIHHTALLILSSVFFGGGSLGNPVTPWETEKPGEAKGTRGNQVGGGARLPGRFQGAPRA